MTVTLNGNFGSGLVVPGGGFFLNNEMDDFTTVPGRPNLYGLVQGPANEVGPGKRMLSSMSPTLATNGEDWVALGSPGGSRIPTAVFQVLAGFIRGEHSLGDAVVRSRVHHQWLPDRLLAEPRALEPGVSADTRNTGPLATSSRGTQNHVR